MGETCSSRGLSWLLKSCISDSRQEIPRSPIPSSPQIFSLPDDLLFECVSRVPPSSLPSISLACRRFSLLLSNPSFHARLPRTLFALSFSDPAIVSCLPFPLLPNPSWSLPLSFPPASLSHARTAVIGRSIYAIAKGSTLRFDSLTASISARSPTIFPRKKFAVGVIAGRIYVSGGTSRTSAVEEYDPESDQWRIVADAPIRRYGCVGAVAGEVFYAVGGVRVGRGEEGAAHTCAGTMDAYHVRAGAWARVRGAVPGGGCAVAACGAGAYVYVLASNAVEVSFWRWDVKCRRGGDWARLEPPPIACQFRFGGSVHFACASVGDAKLAAIAHVSRTGRSGETAAALLVYDIEADQWARGPELPPGLRRAACAFVQC